jgi:LysM repeat protein
MESRALRRGPTTPPSARRRAALTTTLIFATVLVAGCQYEAPEEAQPEGQSSVSAQTTRTPNTLQALQGHTELNGFLLPVRYICVDGDTWEAVAHEFGMKAEVLKEFNSSVKLEAGVELDLRGRNTPQLGALGQTTAGPGGKMSYVVEKGDTTGGITSRFGVPGYALRAANPELSTPQSELELVPGTKLVIPASPAS